TAEGVELTAQDDSPLSAWEATFDFSETRDNVEIVGGTVFEADITRAGAGAVAGGEDIPGLVLNDPAIETFTLNNQRSDGDVVTIAAYEANRVSQITIQDADGNVLGTSDVLPRGQLQEQFNIELDQALSSNQQVTAVAEIVQPEAGDELASETATINIQDQSEAFFSVSDLTPQSATVEDGAVIDVSATVENIGDLEATQEVTLEIGEVPLVQELTLNGSESETVTFADINVSAVGPGEYTHTFSTEDASTSGSLTVQEPPAPAVFEIISVSPEEATATQGDTVTVSATVQNTGDQEATQTVNLDIDGITDSSDLTLGGGEAGSVSFDVDTSGVDAGDYTHTVSTEDDEFSGSLTIENVTMDDNESEDGSGDGSGAGFGVAIAALALLGAALLAARRKAE
ncbi:MAG: PGF-CTERM protein, partial [Halovenus sp.]